MVYTIAPVRPPLSDIDHTGSGHPPPRRQPPCSRQTIGGDTRPGAPMARSTRSSPHGGHRLALHAPQGVAELVEMVLAQMAEQQRGIGCLGPREVAGTSWPQIRER